MAFHFDWSCVAAGAPYITISETGIGVNTPGISLLGEPDEVIVGFDEESMAIGIKKYNGEKNAKSFKFCSRIKNGWVRIGCRDFVRYLSSLSGIDFSPAIRYVAHYDNDEEVLYITVKEKTTGSKEAKESE